MEIRRTATYPVEPNTVQHTPNPASPGSHAVVRNPDVSETTKTARPRWALDHLIERGLPKTHRIRFVYDRGTDEIVIEVIDWSTDEVVRRIPSGERIRAGKDTSSRKGLLADRTL